MPAIPVLPQKPPEGDTIDDLLGQEKSLKKNRRTFTLRPSMRRKSTKSNDEKAEKQDSKWKQKAPVAPLPVTWNMGPNGHMRPSSGLHTPVSPSVLTSKRTMDRHSGTPSLSSCGTTWSNSSTSKTYECSRGSSEMSALDGSRRGNTEQHIQACRALSRPKAWWSPVSAPASRMGSPVVSSPVVSSPVISSHVYQLQGPSMLRSCSVAEAAVGTHMAEQAGTVRRLNAPSAWYRLAKPSMPRRSSLSFQQTHRPSASAEIRSQVPDHNNVHSSRSHSSFGLRTRFSSSHRSCAQSVSHRATSSDMLKMEAFSGAPGLSGVTNSSSPALPLWQQNGLELMPPLPLLPPVQGKTRPHQGNHSNIASVFPSHLESAPFTPKVLNNGLDSPGLDVQGATEATRAFPLPPIEAFKSSPNICCIDGEPGISAGRKFHFKRDISHAAGNSFFQASAWEKAANGEFPGATANQAAEMLTPISRLPHSETSISLRRVDRDLFALASRQSGHSKGEVQRQLEAPEKAQTSSSSAPAMACTPQLTTAIRASCSGSRSPAMLGTAPRKHSPGPGVPLLLRGGQQRAIPACPGPAPTGPLPPIPQPKPALTSAF